MVRDWHMERLQVRKVPRNGERKHLLSIRNYLVAGKEARIDDCTLRGHVAGKVERFSIFKRPLRHSECSQKLAVASRKADCIVNTFAEEPRRHQHKLYRINAELEIRQKLALMFPL